MKNTQIRLLAVTAIPVTAVLLSAQSNTGTSNNQPMQGMQMEHGQIMSSGRMMQACHKNMQSMMDANAKTAKDIAAAKDSNDPSKMRAALDEAEKALSPMNERMKTCMGMMQNIGAKNGMMGSDPKATN